MTIFCCSLLPRSCFRFVFITNGAFMGRHPVKWFSVYNFFIYNTILLIFNTLLLSYKTNVITKFGFSRLTRSGFRFVFLIYSALRSNSQWNSFQKITFLFSNRFCLFLTSKCSYIRPMLWPNLATIDCPLCASVSYLYYIELYGQTSCEMFFIT